MSLEGKPPTAVPSGGMVADGGRFFNVIRLGFVRKMVIIRLGFVKK